MVSPMMQTVIRWRRPSEIESSRYPTSANPCTYLLGNSICYVVSGCLLLVVGVIITSLTFQNLDGSSGENKERYAGPVLIAAGVLVMARGALSRLWPRRRTMSSRRRALLQRYIREIYSRPIFALQRGSTLSLCDLEVSDLHHVCSRTRLYSDDPPSYDVVTNQNYPYQDTHVHAYTNPANDVEVEDEIDTPDFPPRIVITPVSQPDLHHENPCLPQENPSMLHEDPNLPNQDPHEPHNEHSPPPSYDEYIMSANFKTTRL